MQPVQPWQNFRVYWYRLTEAAGSILICSIVHTTYACTVSQEGLGFPIGLKGPGHLFI